MCHNASNQRTKFHYCHQLVEDQQYFSSQWVYQRFINPLHATYRSLGLCVCQLCIPRKAFPRNITLFLSKVISINIYTQNYFKKVKNVSSNVRLFLRFDQVFTAASKSNSSIEILIQWLRVVLIISLCSLVLILRIVGKALSQSAVLMGRVRHT